MEENILRSIFSSKYSKIEHRRQDAKSRPLSMDEINMLLSLRYNNEPIFESIETFYTEEYKNALQSGLSSLETEKIQKFRPGNDKEVNLLYSDIHAKEDQISISNPEN